MPLHVYLHLKGVCLLRAVQSPRHPLQLLRAVLAGLDMRLDHALGYTFYSRQEKIVLVGWFQRPDRIPALLGGAGVVSTNLCPGRRRVQAAGCGWRVRRVRSRAAAGTRA